MAAALPRGRGEGVRRRRPLRHGGCPQRRARGDGRVSVANGMNVAAYLPERAAARPEQPAVMVRPGLELIVLTYALFKAGAVPVLIDPGMGLRAFLRCVADTRPSAFVGI